MVGVCTLVHEIPGENIVVPGTLLSRPVYLLDFEASSLDQDSYPIEVGLAVWPSPDAPVAGWSTLIRPAGAWERRGRWSEGSARVHGIAREDLAAGLPVGEVAAELNARLAGAGVVWCDGGDYDAYWLARLFDSAGIAPAFALGAFGDLTAGLGDEARERVQAALREAPPRHRARADAERLLLALASGLGPGPPSPVDLEVPPMARP